MEQNITILFATDFSETSKVALQTLIKLHDVYDANIHVMHVISASLSNWAASDLYATEVEQRLRTWQQTITPDSALPSRRSIARGNPAKAILNQAKKIDADLIVLGEGHHGLLDKPSTGYTAAAVARNSDISVWLSKAKQIKTILCGVDGSPSSKKALEEALNIARRFSASLSIVHVLPQPDFNPLAMEAEEVLAAENKFKAEKIETIEALLKQFDYSGITVQHYYPWGNASRVLLNLASDFNYDLIILGAKGKSRIQKVLGGTADRVLKKAPCSLLIVR